MIAAAHFENLLFLLFIFVAFLFQLLTRAASKASKGPDQSTPTRPRPTPPATPRARPETDEEQIRKFLDALGQPPGSAPPPSIKTRPTYQKPVVVSHVPPFSSPLPPLTARPPDLPREISLPGQIPVTRQTKTFKPRVAEAPGFEVHDGPLPSEPQPTIKTPAEAYAIATQPVPGPAQSETNVVALLKSPSGLRNAIILREIFGPPRAFSTFSDLTI